MGLKNVKANSFRSIISSLQNLQTPTGGFVNRAGEREPNLQSTSEALFLASLLGIRRNLNADAASRFIQSLENGDYGYGNKVGLVSDVDSVR